MGWVLFKREDTRVVTTLYRMEHNTIEIPLDPTMMGWSLMTGYMLICVRFTKGNKERPNKL